MDNKDTGWLLNKEDILLHREYFKEMCEMIGERVIFRAPREGKKYDLHGELDTFFYDPEEVWVIYQERPNPQTAKKMGWNHELSDGSMLMVVPYDLERVQVGALFIIPSPYDNTKGRLWRVIKMSNSPVYPTEIICELGPVMKSKLEKSQTTDFSKSNFTMMREVTDEDKQDDEEDVRY